MSHSICIYNFGRVRHSSDWNYLIPGSIFWRMYYMLEGSSQVTIYGATYTLRPGHVYIIPAYEPHSVSLQGEFVHEYIHFKIEDEEIDSMLDGRKLTFEAPATPLIQMLFARLSELCRGFDLETSVPQQYEKKQSFIYWRRRYMSQPQCARLEMGSCVQILLAHFIGRSPNQDTSCAPALSLGRRYMHSHACSGTSIEEVARHVGMRTESFIRAFKKHFKTTPHAYIMETRIRKAQNMLLMSTLSIKEIAASCGFSDSSHFCREFRRVMTKSPAAYRSSGG